MKYRTIVADPPWQYTKSPTAARNNMKRWAENEYPTMPIKEMAKLPIAELADDNAHLYMWVTNPRLYGDRGDRSFSPADLMEAWGFSYRTMLTWVKGGAPGMGNYFRIDTEHVLFGVRGNCQVPPAVRETNVFAARRTGHSQKPEVFLDIVERVSPGPYLELFARRNRLGWDTWGNEAIEHVDPLAQSVNPQVRP